MPDRPTARCQAIAASGKPCSATPRPNRPYCLWHDPEADGLRRELSRKGGAARSNKQRAKKALPAEPLTAAELHAYLGVVFKGVIGGRLEPAIATAAATVARTMAELARAADFEARLDRLERTDGRSA